VRKVARDRQWTAAGGERVSARYGVGRDRQRTAARGGPGVSVTIDGPYMERRKSGLRGEPEDTRDRPFAKPCAA
jgi:hypothetical protein